MKTVNIQGRKFSAYNWVGECLHRVNVKSGQILISCFGNFSFRMFERCLPVGSQGVDVLMV